MISRFVPTADAAAAAIRTSEAGKASFATHRRQMKQSLDAAFRYVDQADDAFYEGDYETAELCWGLAEVELLACQAAYNEIKELGAC